MTEISRKQFAVYLVAVVLVVLLGGRALRADAGPGISSAVPPGGFSAQAEPGTAGGSGTSGPTGAARMELSETSERLLVHVAGAVRRPGVYELGPGARIRDALTKAGGGRAGADLDVLNLAAKVTDGQQVLVARRARPGVSGAAVGTSAAAGGAGAGSTSPAAAAAPPGAAGTATGATSTLAPVNVNQADATQLEVLNGVGPAIAAKIVDWRTQNGPFKTVDDLAQVAGIGPKKLEAMRSQVVT